MNGYVYFIKPIGLPGPIKIGFSRAPTKRLIELTAWSPFKLEIVATVPGAMSLETNIHDCLWNAHSHREWFHYTKEVAAVVEALQNGIPIERAINLNARVGSSKSEILIGRRAKIKPKRSTTDATAVDTFVARFGSQTKAAAAIGVSQVLMSKMVKRGKFTPRTAIAVEKITGGGMPVWLTRPDLLEPPAEAAGG